MGLADCFAHFGAVPNNIRYSWSARSPDGKVVVVTFWRDGFDYSKPPPTYSDFPGEGPPAWIARPGDSERLDWMSRPGNRERLENMIWARDHLNGVMHVIIAVAADVMAEPRDIAECYPVRWTMRLTDLDEETGRFRAEQMPLARG